MGLTENLKGKTPPKWNRIAKFCIGVSAAALTLMTTNGYVMDLSDNMIIFCEICLGVGVLGTGYAKAHKLD